jgi:tetratricopeptide (TPR) repeat protein
MKQACATLPKTLRLLALAVALSPMLAAMPVLADDYSDVNQLLRGGKFSDALVKADQYLQGKPRDPQMRFIKGVVQSESGKPFDAIATFTKLTEDYPELPEPYNNLAVLYAGQNQLDKARTALEMAIRTNPSYTTAHENLGDVYAKLASQAYAKALQLDANNNAVQPKLALIRELFAPAGKGQRPGTTVAATPIPTQAPVPTTPTSKPPPVVTPVSPLPPPVLVPISPAPPPATTPAVAPAAGSKDVENAVHAWASAWAAKDMTGYLNAYGKEFDTPGNQSRQSWEEERRKRILGKSSISVKLHDLTVTVKGNTATARFKQEYAANSLSASSRKTLEMSKVGERWLIVKEHSGS